MWYYAPRNLRAVGVSEQTPDINELIINGPSVQKALCKSRKCTGAITAKAIEKKVKPDTDRCPDCGYFLLWKTVVKTRKDARFHEQENQHHR